MKTLTTIYDKISLFLFGGKSIGMQLDNFGI